MIHILKSLSHPMRLRIADTLHKHGSFSVSEIAAMFKLKQPMTSQHLRNLRDSETVLFKYKNGKKYYSLTADGHRIMDALTDMEI